MDGWDLRMARPQPKFIFPGSSLVRGMILEILLDLLIHLRDVLSWISLDLRDAHLAADKDLAIVHDHRRRILWRWFAEHWADALRGDQIRRHLLQIFFRRLFARAGFAAEEHGLIADLRLDRRAHLAEGFAADGTNL